MNVSSRVAILLTLLSLLFCGCAEPQWKGIPIPAGFSPTTVEKLAELSGADGKDAADASSMLTKMMPSGVDFQLYYSDSKSFDEAWTFYQNHEKVDSAEMFPLFGQQLGLVQFESGSEAEEATDLGMAIVASEGNLVALFLMHMSEEDAEKMF